MSTHTIHHIPTDGAWRKIVDRYNGRFRRRWGHPPDAWVLEMQERGAPHLHHFHARQSTFGEVIANSPVEMIERKGKLRTIVRGTADRWLVDAWLKATAQTKDVDAVAFNRGGILELFDGPTGAGNYMAKESSKRQQKQLPEHYEGGLGRWWWMRPEWEPKPVSLARLDLSEWPWEVPVSRVWQWKDIAACITENMAIPPMENPREWREANGFSD